MIYSSQKYRWFAKTSSGWYERNFLKFDENEQTILNGANTEERHNLFQDFQKKSIKETTPPPQVQIAFDNNYDPEANLIIANINDKGHGTVYFYKNNVFCSRNF